MREGIRAGLLKKMDPSMMAAALTGIINSYASKWLTMEEGTSLRNYVPLSWTFFWKGSGKMRNKQRCLWGSILAPGCPIDPVCLGCGDDQASVA